MVLPIVCQVLAYRREVIHQCAEFNAAKDNDITCYIELFGKDWNYRLYLAFGKLDSHMINCVNEMAKARADISKNESLASTQGDPWARYSDRTVARMKGEPLPQVQGPNHQRSEQYEARNKARLAEQTFIADYYKWWEQYERGELVWDNTMAEHCTDCRAGVEKLWDYAHEISYASGYEFTDREGRRQNAGKRPKFMEEVVRLYLKRYGNNWKTISK